MGEFNLAEANSCLDSDLFNVMIQAILYIGGIKLICEELGILCDTRLLSSGHPLAMHVSGGRYGAGN